MTHKYLLNVNDGIDTIHREHPYEECNTDDAEDAITVDELTAMRMLATDQARACAHCDPMTDG